MMANLPFVIWLICWPLSLNLGCYIEVMAGIHKPHDGGGAPLILLIWVGVAVLVYRREGR